MFLSIVQVSYFAVEYITHLTAFKIVVLGYNVGNEQSDGVCSLYKLQ